jgi:hypothetical protein
MLYGKGQPERRVRQLHHTRWLIALVLALVGCAVGSGAVSAQDASSCDTNDGSGVCEPGSTAPEPDPPTSTTPDPVKPPADPPKPPPPAPRQAPKAPAPAQPCPDGALPPCATAEQGESPTTEVKRKRDCRKRPRIRRPRRCRRRAQASPEQQQRRREERTRRAAERKRRRIARERREERELRKKCGANGSILIGATPGQCDSLANRGGILVGRLASRPLPEPLPPSARLDPGFASLLKRVAGKHWPEVLAILRGKGQTGAAPAKAAELKQLARRVKRGGKLEERVQALADYHRAVGLEGLTRGLDAVKGDLIDRVLRVPTISIYGPGRTDVANGSIDVRILVTMLYLAERQGGVTVTSLISGHGVLTKSGNVSLHAYGRAMDIVAVGGTPIIGHQQPGGVTETALRNIMMMPPEFRPDELISLFDIGGPSFAMSDHADHIHVGF